jgi:hypothetical protein
MKFGVSQLVCVASVVLLNALLAMPTRAQASSDQENLSPTAADRLAADEANVVYRHARPARTEAGTALKQHSLEELWRRRAAGAQASTTIATVTTDVETNDQIRYPADLKFNGGAVVQVAESHPIFLLPHGTCPIAKCWGNPLQFLTDFAGSTFAHITDQYVRDGAGNRYTVGKSTSSTYTPPTKPLIDAQIQAFVHSVASRSGTGLHHIYHVFLPPGQDECFTSADTACYSPDKPSTFAFCAYHSSVKFKDLPDEVLYTVEPFQDVPGCNVRPGTPNGQLVDSTNSTLSHELIETITDPNGTAWFNLTSGPLFLQEIGDECVFVIPPTSATQVFLFSDPSVFKMGLHTYAVQPEYNNEDHACTVEP